MWLPFFHVPPVFTHGFLQAPPTWSGRGEVSGIPLSAIRAIPKLPKLLHYSKLPSNFESSLLWISGVWFRELWERFGHLLITHTGYLGTYKNLGALTKPPQLGALTEVWDGRKSLTGILLHKKHVHVPVHIPQLILKILRAAAEMHNILKCIKNNASKIQKKRNPSDTVKILQIYMKFLEQESYMIKMFERD